VVTCVAVGIVAGLGACLFYWMLQGGMALFLGLAAHYVPPEAGGEPSPFAPALAAVPREPIRWLLVLMPALGGLLSGWLVFTFAPEAEGHGTDSAILSFHHLGGRIRARVPIIKTVSAAITIGSGGSGGREGPIAQIGAGFWC
jgi:CIC family chloride channel protein